MVTLSDIKQQYPAYKDIPDDQLADAMHQKFYSNMDRDTFNQAIGFQPSESQVPEQSKTGEFVKGVERAGSEMGSLAMDALPAFAKSLANQTFGSHFDNAQNLRDYQKDTTETQKNYAAKIPSYKDIKTPGDFVDYVASTMGEQVPNLLLGIGSGSVGGTLAEMTADQLAKQTGQQLSKEQAASAIKKGAALGIGATLLPQNVSGNYMDYMAEGKDKPFHALATGGLQTGLQMLPEMGVVNKLLGPDLGPQVVGSSLLRKFGIPEDTNISLTKASVSAADSALQFAGANMGSTALGILGDHFVDSQKDMFTKDSMQSIIDQGLKGLVGGAAMGGAASALHTGILPEITPPRAETEGKLNSDKTFTDLYGAMKPTYISDSLLYAAPKMGINAESLANLHPNQVQEVQTAIKSALNPTEAPSTIDPTLMKEALQHRNDLDTPSTSAEDTLKRNKSVWDASFNKPVDYVPGDGVIHAGATLRDDDVQGHPAQRVQMDDPDGLARLQTTVPKPPFKLRTDNPGGDWLERTKANAEKNYSPEDEGMSAKGLAGAVTGTIKGSEENAPTLPTSLLQNLPGANNEHLKDTSGKLNRILEDTKPGEGIRNPVMIGVNHKGEPYLMEGNNRVKAASKLGIDRVPVEIQYRNGGEREEGLFHPNKILHLLGETNPKDPRLQLGVKADPVHGDLFSDGIVPLKLADNLQALPHTDGFNETHAAVMDDMKRILKEVFGLKEPELKFFDALRDPKAKGSPVLGAQIKTAIALALHDSTRGNVPVPETMYHEAFHMLMERGAFKEAELSNMIKQKDLLKRYFDRDGHLTTQDFDRMMQVDPEEVLANAMGKMANDYRQDRNSISKIPAPFRAAFRKFKNFLEKTANMLKGHGFNSIHDIVHKMVEGEIGARTEDYKSRQYLEQFNPKVTDLAHDLSYARLMRAADKRKQIDIDDRSHFDNLREIASELRKDYEKIAQDTNKRMGLWAQKVSAMYMQGQKIPILGLLYNSADRRMNRAQEMLSNYGEAIHPWTNLSKDHRYLAMDWMDNLAKRKLKAYINKDGRLAYQDAVRDPVTKEPIWDPVTKSRKYEEFTLGVDGDAEASKKVAQGYMGLKEGFKRQLDDWEKLQKKLAFEDYPNYMPENFTQKDINAKIDEIPKNEKGKTDLSSEANKKLFNRLVAIRDQLDAIDNMRRYEYTPQTRFGSHGYVVRDRTRITKEHPQGVPVAFHTVEQGAFNKTYDMTQKKGVMDELKRERSKEEMKRLGVDIGKAETMAFSDTKRFDVIGAKGKITSFDHATDHPFAMTHNKLASEIDPRFINVETLSALLTSRNLDPLLYNSIHEEISKDILSKKFEKKFDRKEGMEGYSRDWDRVVHGHLSGSAHFLSGIDHQREVSIIKGEIDKLAGVDPRLHAKATDFIDYVNSPQEDYQRLRTMNMLWVMGGNVGTALTVAMTLPTTTLGQLAKFDSNFLRNGQRMGKWSALSHQILASTNPKEVLKTMVESGKIKQAQADAFIKFMEVGKIRSEMMSESVGKLKQDALSKTAQYLGAPVAYMERMVRAATLMAAHEALLDNPDAKARAERVLAYDHNFQASRLMDKSKTFEEAAAMNIMDKSHGVYGKLGRPDMFKGLGGALFMPFQTFPYYALSSLAKSLGEGKEGKIAFATTVGALMFFCGVQGIPGVEQLEDLYEEASKASGHEQVPELMLMEKLYGMTGDKRFAEFITHGFGNAFAGIDGSKRWGLPIAGYDIFRAVTGMGGSKPSNLMGVEGTILQGVGNAWGEYKAGGGPVNILKAMMPSGISSPLKALSYATDGVWTNPNSQDMKTRLIPKEEVSNWTIISRALGITSSQVAEARERNFDAKLANTQYEPMLNEYKSRASMLETKIATTKDPAEKREAIQALIQESKDFANQMKDLGYMAPMSAINSAIRNQVFKNYTATPKVSKNPTIAKQQMDIINMYKDKK